MGLGESLRRAGGGAILAKKICSAPPPVVSLSQTAFAKPWPLAASINDTPIMARKPLTDLLKFLKPFDKEVQKSALKLRDFVLDIFPDANELIYDNYNALAIGYSLSDKQKEMFCHIAVYSKYVNIGFDRGVELDDPKQILKGTGNRIRHITVTDFMTFQKSYVQKLLIQAHKLTLDILDKKTQVVIGQSIVKSISPNKKRPT